MICAWQAYLNLLPFHLRDDVDKLGSKTLQELRLRINLPPELICADGTKYLTQIVRKEDIRYCINVASQYSPWAAQTSARGYITAQGGHRVGICGETITASGIMTGISNPTSVCIRVCRDFYGIANQAAHIKGSILILGRPGSGKTTLLRDLIRQKSDFSAENVSVVDERCELFPITRDGLSFACGRHTDVISGCTKQQGIDCVLRNMNPSIIAVDEITAQEDCDALIRAGWCGVSLLATAHASTKADLYSRSVYRPIVNCGLFDTLLVLQEDKSWKIERMKL